MRSEEEKKEQRRKAQKKYYEKNKEYYRKQSLEENKRVRKERNLYKEIIKEVREYIENNDLYEQDYDYDYEENLVVGPPSDETARKILLEILDKVSDE